MRDSKKILYIGNKLAIHGQSPTSIDTLTLGFREEGYGVVAASSKRNRLMRLGDMMLTLIQNRRKVDIVLIDTYSTQNFYYAIILAGLSRFFKLPYIPILHGGNLSKRLKRNKGLSKNLFGKAYINVTPSLFMKKQFEDAGFHNLTYIPNTIGIKNYPFLVRKSIKPKLLWVRSFAEIYNPLLALEVVEILKKKGLEVELCMVGPEKDGTLERCKRVVKDLNLPVTFTGILKKEKWIDLSKNYDIFINTTNFDNMPVSVMEAMALGMPVISTNVGGIPFLVDSEIDGILVDPNNPQVFVEAIIDLCQNPTKTQKISENARAKMEHFDWEEVKHRWIELFGF